MAVVAALPVCLAAKATPPAAAVIPVDFHDSHVMHGQLGENSATLKYQAGLTCKLLDAWEQSCIMILGVSASIAMAM